MNWEPRWELGFETGIAQVPGCGIIWEMGPSVGRGRWHQSDGELGLPRHQHHQLGTGNWDQCLHHLGTGSSQRHLSGTGTWTSIALALGTGTRSHWFCLGTRHQLGTNWVNWSTS